MALPGCDLAGSTLKFPLLNKSRGSCRRSDLMLNFAGPESRLCEGPTRRDVLRLGSLGAFGAFVGLPDLANAAAPMTADASFGKAKSCIFLFLFGGPAQHSTWDPKPDAPAEVRGPFGPIATSVPGLLL